MVCEDRERKHVGLSVGHECSREGLWRLGAQRGDERSPAGGPGSARQGGGAQNFHSTAALA
jgi:hypothetical protein